MDTDHDAKSAGEKKLKSATNIVPLFSWRSILILTIGLVIGVGLGLGYYFASPFNNSTDQVWEGGVQVKVAHPMPTSMDARTLQIRTEYYVAKAQSLAFLEFLNQKIVEETPQYSHTADELAGMINIEYNALDSNPVYKFQVTVTAPSVEEVTFLITRIPEVFKSYLIAEENNKQQQEYQNTLQAIEATKTALLEAQQKLSNLTPEGIANSIENDPTYIVLDAKIRALEVQLDRLTPGLADIVVSSNSTDTAYTDIIMAAVNRTSAALADAKKELAIMETQWANGYSTLNLEYQLTQDQVNNLNNQLTSLNEKQDSLLVNSTDTSELTGYIIIGNPDIPTSPVVPLKLEAALVVGALIGVVVAWLALNFRWLVGTPPTSSKEEEEEA
jgi:hypothetical protein